MKTLIFFRHGRTEYTEVFPDLTKEGLEDANNAAILVRDIIEREEADDVQIISSPLKRALGVADIIANKISYKGNVREDTNIRCSDFYHPTIPIEKWKSFPSNIAAEENYKTDPWFETGIYVEKRSDTTSRFFVLISELLYQYEEKSLPDVTVVVSHFEVLWKLVEKFNLPGSVSYCEPIIVHFMEGEDSIDVSVTFRKTAMRYSLGSIYEFFNKQFYN